MWHFNQGLAFVGSLLLASCQSSPGVVHPNVVPGSTELDPLQLAMVPGAEPLPSNAGSILTMSWQPTSTSGLFDGGQHGRLRVSSRVNAWLHCFRQTATGDILRIYPLGYLSAKRVSAGDSLEVPAPGQMVISLNPQGDSEAFLCIAAAENLGPKLGHLMTGPGMQSLPVGSFNTLYEQFDARTDASLIGRVIRVSAP